MIKIIINGNVAMAIEPREGGVYTGDSIVVTRTHSVDENNVARLVEGLPIHLQVHVDKKEYYGLSSVEKLIALVKDIFLNYNIGECDGEKITNIIKEIEEAQNTKDKQFAQYKKFVEALCEEDDDLDFWASEYKHALEKLSKIEELEKRCEELEKHILAKYLDDKKTQDEK